MSDLHDGRLHTPADDSPPALKFPFLLTVRVFGDNPDDLQRQALAEAGRFFGDVLLSVVSAEAEEAHYGRYIATVVFRQAGDAR
ncbi:hypothetical protein ACQP25_17090 [Microtetraspora malaysiensis]|uniref:hypothetical protein n=1 Tax=Microtetraspora malaysiensis TaxID=161358 RepID=UPI003D91ADF8